MSLTLALDTATDWASVALGDGDGLIAQVVLGRRRHAAGLMPAISHVLAAAGGGIGDVGAILLADGPGSFTGLRLGAATVQGLVRGKPGARMATAPSLQVAAWVGSLFHPGEAVAAWYDALRGEVFAGTWRFAADRVETLQVPERARPDSLVAAPPPALVVGDGAAAYRDLAASWTGRPAVGPPAGAPRASGLLALDALGACTPVEDVFGFVPTYGRPAEAQARWEAEHGRPLPDSPGHYS